MVNFQIYYQVEKVYKNPLHWVKFYPIILKEREGNESYLASARSQELKKFEKRKKVLDKIAEMS